MHGYVFLIEVEGLDQPVWQEGYGDTEVERRRDAEARVAETYGDRAVTSWAHPADAESQPDKNELYWHMEVDAWLAQLTEIRGLPERGTDELLPSSARRHRAAMLHI